MFLLADRFLQVRDAWIDIATADPVDVAVRPAGSLRAQIDWAERCVMLARLRHTLLRPLVDYGIADGRSFFEAYARRPALEAAAATASRLVTHLGRFLDAHGVTLTAEHARLMIREVRRVRQRGRLRPLGIVLQPRLTLEPVVDLLSGVHGLRGATSIRVCGPPGSGLRTFVLAAAHQARVAGYVAVAARALTRWPALREHLDGRHVCLFTDGDGGAAEQAAAAILLTRLATLGPRPHVCLAIARSGDAAIHLESLGVTSMTTMTYTDPDFGPTAPELFDAARFADGLPGRFLARLSYGSAGTRHPTAFVVHETAAEYRPAAPIPEPSTVHRVTARSRIGSVLWRAGSRASALARRGRHAAAGRVLTRAARVLDGRGERAQAAAYLVQLAWMARNRGALTAACAHADHAAAMDERPENRIVTGCVHAACRTDQARLIEAEASLRTLAAAASEIGGTPLGQRCALLLARVYRWQDRPAESLALLVPLLDAGDEETRTEAWLLTSRARSAVGDVAAALEAAREGGRRAGALGDPRLVTGAAIAMAEALLLAGDVDGVRSHVDRGIAAAAAAHLPLTTLRLRTVLLRAIRGREEFQADAERLRLALGRLRSGSLPPLYLRRIAAACDAPSSVGPHRGWSDTVSIAQVEAFLDTAQRSGSDLEAVQHVVAAVCARLGAASVAVIAAAGGRVIASAGKPWREPSLGATQALTGGQSVALDLSRHPPELAEPVKCAGDVVGAIACRWPIGTTHVAVSAGATVRAAAMAIATHVRAVLDTTVNAPPPSAWGDLLGESAGAAAIRDAVHRASRAPFPVLIEGESGSGKELVARAIHKLSARHTRRFCAINCAALSDELIEAELFGHARGAFTGALTERAGLFEEADGGTLFLDEIGELSARAQAKLLRVLQEGEVRRVGENQPRRVDVRIVAATNRRLEHEAVQGRFRTDLRFRLDVLRIVVPPLRDRIADIPILAQHFWRQASARVGTSATLGPDALAALARHDWPGNVRELQNAIAWIAVHAPRRGRVSVAMLPSQLASGPMATGSFEAAREEFERRFVRAALAQAGGHRQAAARALGVSRQGLSKMLRRLRIEPDGPA